MTRWTSLNPDSSPMVASRKDISTTSFRPPQFPYKWYFCCLIQHHTTNVCYIPLISEAPFSTPKFTSTDAPIYLTINADVVPYWILQDPAAKPYVTHNGELLLLLDRFLYGLKQSLIKSYSTKMTDTISVVL